jgi:UDP-GlcNAc3NAcA epimerase
LLATLHRVYNTDAVQNFEQILSALIESGEEIIFPVHPRTRKKIDEIHFLERSPSCSRLRIIELLGYLDILTLERSFRLILIDSGGIQKEAFFYAALNITLRLETE